MRAILSVYNKDGLVDFAKGLSALGVELFSTGGTKGSLEQAGLHVSAVEEITGFPEILDGRVKTLHPAVHGGLLARRELPDHLEQLRKHHITPIDMVVVNLYPFAETIAKPGSPWKLHWRTSTLAALPCCAPRQKTSPAS